MTISNTDGDKTATGAEDILATITTSGSFVLGLDSSEMTLGDELVVRVKLKVRSTGVTRLAYEATYAHNQSLPVILSIPVASTNEIVFTIEQVSGVNRTYPWEIWSL